MATTEKGIYYPDDGTKSADVLADLEQMAESVDEAIEKEVEENKYNDADIKKDISDIKEEQQTQNKNIEQNTTKNKEQDELISKLKSALINVETEEAKSLHIEDASEVPAQLKVLGNQEQETREGYNFLQNNLTDTTINGVTFKINEDKSVTVNGTATASIIANLTTGEFEDGNGSVTNFTIPNDVSTLKLTGCPSGGSSSSYKLDLWNSHGFLKGTDYGEGTNISISSDNDRKLNRARIIIYSGATVNNLTFKPMLVAGTEEKPYEQYGSSPSPNYPSKIVCLGSNKNLFNIENDIEFEGKYRTARDGTILVNNDYNGIKVSVEENTNYIISFEKDRSLISNLCFLDKDGVFISGKSYSSGETLFTTPLNCKYISLAVGKTIEKLKLEEGEIETSYSPYRTR